VQGGCFCGKFGIWFVSFQSEGKPPTCGYAFFDIWIFQYQRNKGAFALDRYVLQPNQVKRTAQDYINELII